MVKVKYYRNHGSIAASISYGGNRVRITRKTKAELAPLVKAQIAEFTRLNARQLATNFFGIPQNQGVGYQRKSVADAIIHYIEKRKIRTDHRNLSVDRHIFKVFHEFMFERLKVYVDQINKDDLEALQIHLIERGNKASSVNRWMASVNGFFSVCEDNGWITLEHVMKLRRLKKLPEMATKVAVAVSEELQLLLELIPSQFQYVKDFALTMDEIISRPRELANANVYDVDFERDLITLSSAKGGKVSYRKTPFTRRTRDRLARLVSGRALNEPLFVNTHGNRVDPNTVHEVIRNARKAFWVQNGRDCKITLYSIRRKIITELADSEVGLEKIKDLAGHKRVETTLRYVHLKDASLRRVVDLLEENRSKAVSGRSVENTCHKTVLKTEI